MLKKLSNSKYSEDWLPVKSIQNGMILLEGDYYVTGIKIEPKNIFILDYQTQNNIIFNLRNFYNIIDHEFWLIVADRPVDINLYLSQLQLQYNDATNQASRKIISEDIAKAELFSNTQVNAVDTEYFILFRNKKTEVLQKRVHTMISTLAGVGLISRQVSDEDLKFLLQNFLNGGVKNEYGTVMSNV
ncbi:MAG: hypothetical protein PHX04_02530 [Bacilli bacterium]|nr:hypothetical protein [Bacilli bacterium]